MHLTSSWRLATAPRRRTRFSSMALRSLAWSSTGSASISSKNNVPCAALSRRPGLGRLASVKVPASKPNNSTSNRVSGIAAQLTSTNAPWARGPLSWITRATSPLPVPVSPCSNSVGTKALPTVSKVARWRIWARKASMTGACPTMRSVGWACGTGSDCAITASRSTVRMVTVGSAISGTKWPQVPIMAAPL
jgi:hypothetical protein